MSKQNIDVTNVSDWANLIIGLLDKGEWKTLIFTLILAFAITYILKIVYFTVVPKEKGRSNHIRLIAIISGFIAAALAWNGNAISMAWYTAGLMVGPLSIALHHILQGVVNMKAIKDRAPFLSKLLKGTLK